MTRAEAMTAELANESVSTRKMLERLPEDKLSWKPHPKSMSMSRLATHVAEILEWAKTIVEDESFDMAAADFEPRELGSKQAILDLFDKNVDAFKNLLGGQTDAHLFEHWKLKQGEHVAIDLPRIACLRGFVLSHLIHHRGQLSVYLRENDVPLPAIYGPSADENM